MTEEQRELFKEAAKPLIKFLNDHVDPHAKVIVETTSAELVRGECAFNTVEFVKD